MTYRAKARAKRRRVRAHEIAKFAADMRDIFLPEYRRLNRNRALAASRVECAQCGCFHAPKTPHMRTTLGLVPMMMMEGCGE